MSITKLDIFDAISIDLMSNVVLTISDELVWDNNNEHLYALQNKINVYLEFIESGNLYQQYPDAEGRNIVINLISKYSPNDNAKIFLDKTAQILQSAGYDLQFKVLADNKWRLSF